jgi:hypothetical protein
MIIFLFLWIYDVQPGNGWCLAFLDNAIHGFVGSRGQTIPRSIGFLGGLVFEE